MTDGAITRLSCRSWSFRGALVLLNGHITRG